MGIIKMSHHLFKLFLLPVQRSTDEHGLTIPHIAPACPWAGTRVLGTALARLWPPVPLPEHVARDVDAALGGPRSRRGDAPRPREPCARPSCGGAGTVASGPLCPSPPHSPWTHCPCSCTTPGPCSAANTGMISCIVLVSRSSCLSYSSSALVSACLTTFWF